MIYPDYIKNLVLDGWLATQCTEETTYRDDDKIILPSLTVGGKLRVVECPSAVHTHSYRTMLVKMKAWRLRKLPLVKAKKDNGDSNELHCWSCDSKLYIYRNPTTDAYELRQTAKWAETLCDCDSGWRSIHGFETVDALEEEWRKHLIDIGMEETFNFDIGVDDNNELETISMILEEQLFVSSIDAMANHIHELAQTNDWSANNEEMIALIHSELSKAFEGMLHGNPPDAKLPKYTVVEGALANVVIRVLSLCSARGYRIGDAIWDKYIYNRATD